jgi:LuxR family maltose regulon positive regulatory protein
MDNGRAKTTWDGAQGHIIERPRLTSLLDESGARIILLVAPAGYGKTTLIREWLRGSDGTVWYSGGPTMADVAALAVELGEAIAERTEPAHDIDEDVERLRMLAARGHHPSGLARAVAGLTRGEGVIVVEDCHHAADAADSQAFLETFASMSRTRLVVTSRTRPSWVSARLSVYGDALVLGADQLAFTPAEASVVLAHVSEEVRQHVLAQARGWPAAVGLAAMRSEAIRPQGISEPDDIYQFFAEELFRRTAPELKHALFLLALGGDTDHSLTADLLGADQRALIAAGLDAGFLTNSDSGAIGIHPLLKGFLLQKLGQRSPAEVDAIVDRYVTAAAARGQWDQCLLALESLPRAALIISTLAQSIATLLQTGRVATIRRWLALATLAGAHHPVVMLAEAEAALRDGSHRHAQVIGERAAALAKEPELAARAHLAAARAAHLQDDDRSADLNAERAEALAQVVATKRDALWVNFASALEHGDERLLKILERLHAIPDDSDEHALRLRHAEGYMRFDFYGDAYAASHEYDLAAVLLTTVDDPFIRSGFLTQWAYLLTALARYDDALRVVEQVVAEAEASGLQFALDHARLTRANALIGLRKLHAAQRTFAEMETDGVSEHLVTNKSIVAAKLRIALGDLERADISLQRDPAPTVSANLRAELVAYRALVHAGLGDLVAARREIEEGEAGSNYRIAAVARQLASAIIAVQEGVDRVHTGVHEIVHRALDTGHMDTVLTACRVYPRLAQVAASADTRMARQLGELFAGSQDGDLGRRAGLQIPRELRRNDGLSAREREVYEHLIQGRSNREIAAALFISQSTAKVHVRHIFEKLGVRTRVEAATLAWNELRPAPRER